MVAFDIIAFDRPLHKTLFSILFDVIQTDFRRFRPNQNRTTTNWFHLNNEMKKEK